MSSKKTVDVIDTMTALVTTYHNANQQKKALERELTALKTKLETLVPENTTLTVGGYVVSYTTFGVDRFDTKNFRQDHPKMAKQYTVETTSTRLTVAKTA